jgi:hypothetical protein
MDLSRIETAVRALLDLLSPADRLLLTARLYSQTRESPLTQNQAISSGNPLIDDWVREAQLMLGQWEQGSCACVGGCCALHYESGPKRVNIYVHDNYAIFQFQTVFGAALVASTVNNNGGVATLTETGPLGRRHMRVTRESFSKWLALFIIP